jgi:hypothetical protein
MRSTSPSLKSQLCLVGLCLAAFACDGDDDSDGGRPDATVVVPGLDGGGQFTGTGTGGTGSGGTGTGGWPGFGGTGGTPGFGGSSGFMGTPLCTACMCANCSNCINCGTGCFCQDTQMGDPPAPLPWDPPFSSLGDVGYMDSTTPLCSGINTVAGFGVWSDSRGVYALISGSGTSQVAVMPEGDGGVDIGDMGPQAGQNLTRTQLWQNDGSSWALRMDEVDLASTLELSGIPGGPLIVNDPSNFEILSMKGIAPSIRKCALGTFASGELACQDVDPVQDVVVVDDQLAYAVMGGTRLLSFDGKTWHGNTNLLPYPATALWADHDDLIAVGRAGTVLWYAQGMWTLEDPGTLESFTSVWGTSRSDVYAGTSSGAVLHYDGSKWKQIAKLGGTSCKTQLPVTGIWGVGSTVFFHSDAQFARWNGTKLESLGNWTCSPSVNGLISITNMWGNSATEVFLSIIDPSRSFSDLCGGEFVVRFDGKKFHRM